MRVRFLKESPQSTLMPRVCYADVQLSEDPKLSGAHILQDFKEIGEAPAQDRDTPFLHRGLMDSHLHLAWIGEQQRRIVGDQFSSADDYLLALQKELQRDFYSRDEILMAYAFDEERWGMSLRDFEKKVLAQLDSDRRWILFRVCGHSAFASRALLESFSMSVQSPLLDDRGIHELQRRLPPPDIEVMKNDILRAQQLMLECGINAVGDMSLDRPILTSILALRDEGLLELDYQGVYLDGSFEEFEKLGPLLPDTNPGKKHFEIAHWKRYLDGSFGSHTAYLRNPYFDKISERGLQLHDTQELIEASRRALSRGFALSFHAIGDGALEQILDLSEVLRPELTQMNLQRSRCVHRIEHAQLVGADQIARLQKLGLWLVCVQPYHRVADKFFSEKRLGLERLYDEAYVLGSFLKAGLPTSLGSDAPITFYDPYRTLSAAITHPNPQEAVPLEQALWLMSEGARRVHGLPVGDWGRGQRVWVMEPRNISQMLGRTSDS